MMNADLLDTDTDVEEDVAIAVEPDYRDQHDQQPPHDRDKDNKDLADGHEIDDDDDDDDAGSAQSHDDNINNKNDDDDDDDPVAEGDEPALPKPEPSYAKANALSFYGLCQRMECLWKLRFIRATARGGGGGGAPAVAGTKRGRQEQRRHQHPPLLEEKLQVLLPPRLLQFLSTPSSSRSATTAIMTADKKQEQQQLELPESLFPLFRLLIPEKDTSRQCYVKELILAKAYGDALGLHSTQRDYQKLIYYTNPDIVLAADYDHNTSNDTSITVGMVGDFSLVLQHVVTDRIGYNAATGSDFTLGDVNRALDQLASIPRKARRQQQQPSRGDGVTPSSSSTRSIRQMRAEWVRSLNPSGRRGLTPLEHKWLVRILQKRLQLGVGSDLLLNWYDPYATVLWSAHNSLKGICNLLCDPDFVRPWMVGGAPSASSNPIKLVGSSMVEGDDVDVDDEQRHRWRGVSVYMPASMAQVCWGQALTPMRSEKTGFDRILDDISRRHRQFAATVTAINNSLSFRHPAFGVEIKLDGERFVIHKSRTGVIKMQTRQGNWYSDQYSPVLGPALRRSLARHAAGMDIILDGEILSWDNGRQETVPFGSNRTVANMRLAWMRRRGGMLDAIDRDIHAGETDVKIFNPSNSWAHKSDRDPNFELAGAECWLQFIAFDVLFVDGPGAAELLNEAVSAYVTPRPSPGPLVHLDGFERKRILYKLIEPQIREVEIVPTWIIRPNGRTEVGSDYFHPTDPVTECGYPAYLLDSLSMILSGAIPDLAKVDMERRRERSDDAISHARAGALNRLYMKAVESDRQEGLMFKDLAAPYYVGDESKSMRYWYKFKPDYFKGSVASDLDVAIIGSFFATGLRLSGKPASFLCACLDSEDRESFMTLCKVNAASMDFQTFHSLLDYTGFVPQGTKDREATDGRWFREGNHGTSLPSFISPRSNQVGHENSGWKFGKKEYPDLWIEPTDAPILTLNAGEIVATDIFSAGVTLRFPRIQRVRYESDGKPLSHIEDDLALRRIYRDVMESRAKVGNGEVAVTLGSPAKGASNIPCRFLTEDQYAESTKRKKNIRTSKKQVRAVQVVANVEQKSSVLSGLSFSVLDGVYFVDPKSVDAEEGREQGWLIEASGINSGDDVQSFIKQHGGTVKIDAKDSAFVLGGRGADVRVVSYIRALERKFADAGRKTWSKQLAAAEKDSISEQPGVLRWTFVFSLVHRWLTVGGRREPIAQAQPEFIRPTILDFLSRPQKPGSDPMEDICSESIDNVFMMRRALDLVGQMSKDGADSRENAPAIPWQTEALRHLRGNERWVLSSPYQTIGPFSKAETSSLVVLYPDMFVDGHGHFAEADIIANCKDGSDRARWKAVRADAKASMLAAALPLARSMGAIVTPHLHDGVTHVLCCLRGTMEALEVKDETTADVFEFSEEGSSLLARLKATEPMRKGSMHLVTIAWIRKRAKRRG